MINENEFMGVQTYINQSMYCIEYYVGPNTILVEYDDIDKWIKILTLLDHNI